MADKLTQLGSPAIQNTPTVARQIGNGFGMLTAAVNLWTVSDDGAVILATSDSAATAAVELPENNGAISILASGGRMRFKLGDEDVVATATSNVINGVAEERLDILLKQGQTHISVISDDGADPGQLDIMGLGTPPSA